MRKKELSPGTSTNQALINFANHYKKIIAVYEDRHTDPVGINVIYYCMLINGDSDWRIDDRFNELASQLYAIFPNYKKEFKIRFSQWPSETMDLESTLEDLDNLIYKKPNIIFSELKD